MAYDKEYYQKHKEEYKERARNWYLNNKERHKELLVKREALKCLVH